MGGVGVVVKGLQWVCTGEEASAGDVKRSNHSVLKRASARRGFTLLELLAVLLVIAILVGILSIAFAALTGQANDSASRQDLSTIRNAVTSFESEFGFLPPLIKDAPAADRIDRTTDQERISVWDPASRDAATAQQANIYLRDESEVRASEFSLGYYLAGALDAAVDGIEGVGFRTPRRDGTFAKAGAEHEPFVDVGTGGGVELVQRGADLTEGDVGLGDRFGTPYRYYRWEPEAAITEQADLNVPAILGDLDAQPELRSARCAIVSAGQDTGFGTGDDVFEVGN